MKQITINNRIISSQHSPYIIAEVSGNHNGDLNKALKLLEVAKQAGADAVKIQTYTADTMTIDHDSDDFLIKGGLWDGQKLYDLYQWAHTPWEWHQALFARAQELELTIFSSPFDESAVDFLESLNAPAYKIASFELTDIPLIEKVAQTGKPIIMSTGLANQEEIREAIDTATKNGCKELALLHCISAYPAPLEQANVSTLVKLRDDFNTLVGLSDHTLGVTASVTAVALGACIIEKHFTFDRNEPGPDSAFSLEPHELKQLCEETKAAWSALGTPSYELKQAEQENLKFRRSIYAVKDIKKGEKITVDNIKRIRPGYGLTPKHYKSLIESYNAKEDIKRGTPLSWSNIIEE